MVPSQPCAALVRYAKACDSGECLGCWVRKAPGAEPLSDAEQALPGPYLTLVLQRPIQDSGTTARCPGCRPRQPCRCKSPGRFRDPGRGGKELREPQVFAGVTLRDALGRVQAWGRVSLAAG